MKHTLTHFRLLALPAILACAPLLRGNEPAEVRWTDVCSAAHGRELIVTTTTGDIVTGQCTAVHAGELSVTTREHRVFAVARKAVSRIRLHRAKGSQIASLGRHMHAALRQEKDWIFSEYAPLGLVSIPGTVAWGAVSAPFCILGDLGDMLAGTQEIKVI